MRTADDDSVPVPYDAFRLPRAVLNWNKPYPRGVSERRQRAELAPERTPVTRLDASSGSRAESRAGSGSRAESRAGADELDDEPTRMMPVYVRPGTPERDTSLARGTARLEPLLTRAAELWREGPLRTAAMLAGVALITYLAVGGARRGANNGTQTIFVPATALPAVAPIIVEQLNGARQPRETAAKLQGEQSDRTRSRSAGSHARDTLSTAPVSKSGGNQTLAPTKSKSRRAGRSTSTSSGSVGLPAWGAEAVQEFSGGKTGSSAAATSRSQALTAKPPSSSAALPPPMAAYRPTATATVPAREQPKPAPVVAAKPAEPPKPVAPPRPSKPLTMDQVLNQVEDVAKAQRKQAGLKAPKTSKRDAELDELINGSMTSKKK